VICEKIIIFIYEIVLTEIGIKMIQVINQLLYGKINIVNDLVQIDIEYPVMKIGIKHVKI
jgi:hypothetical protein